GSIQVVTFNLNESQTSTLTSNGLSNAGSIQLQGGSVTATANLVVNGNATNSGTGTTTVSNFAKLIVNGANNSFNLTGGNVTVNGTGTLTAPTINVTGGTLQGTGTVIGATNLSSTGIIQGGFGGAPFGTLTVQGPFSITGGTVQSQLGTSLQASVVHSTSGPVITGGTLSGVLNGASLAAGQSYTAMTFPTFSEAGLF